MAEVGTQNNITPQWPVRFGSFFRDLKRTPLRTWQAKVQQQQRSIGGVNAVWVMAPWDNNQPFEQQKHNKEVKCQLPCSDNTITRVFIMIFLTTVMRSCSRGLVAAAKRGNSPWRWVVPLSPQAMTQMNSRGLALARFLQLATHFH